MQINFIQSFLSKSDIALPSAGSPELFFLTL